MRGTGMEIAKERKRENCRFHEAQDRHNGLAGEYIISASLPLPHPHPSFSLSRSLRPLFLSLSRFLRVSPSAIFICVEYINAPRDM
jgi:hypothetical protein